MVGSYSDRAMKLLARLLLAGGGNLQVGDGEEMNCNEAFDRGDKGTTSITVHYGG